MNVRDLKTKYCLEPADLPNKGGLNIVTIVGLEQETYTPPGQRQPKTRLNLWFRELQLPLRLNNTRLDVLAKVLGEETAEWTNRKIGLFIGMLTNFGESKEAIMIHLQPQDGIGTPGAPQQLPPAGQATPQKPPTAVASIIAAQNRAQDVRPIGAGGASKLKIALAEQGATFDELGAWLKREHPAIHERVVGVALEDIPMLATDAIAYFLKNYSAIKNPPRASQPEPDAGIAEDDIPFNPEFSTWGAAS